MDKMPSQVCAICGEQRIAGQVWFLLAESAWEDKLRILQWQDRLANREGIHRACSPAHVQELVTHWMALGTLDYPFANSGPAMARSPRTLASVPVVEEPDTAGVRQVGEISVHRESIGRLLDENPEALQVILDELSDALERESESTLARFESVGHYSGGSLRHM